MIVESTRFSEYIMFNLVSSFYVANTTGAPAIGGRVGSNVVKLELEVYLPNPTCRHHYYKAT
jgi:hypothetical protein